MAYRNIFVMIFLLITISKSHGQERYFTKTGIISFKAGTSVEDVDGVNNTVSSIIDITTGKVELAVLIKGFEFKRGLMQEHFNENYMESGLYPKATFKGKIKEVPGIDLKKDGVYPVHVAGTLNIHNINNEIELSINLTVENGVIKVDNEFAIDLADYKIEVPAAVKDKVSPHVAIHFKATLKPVHKA